MVRSDGAMDEQQFLLLWGKTDRANPANYHPLLFHLLDVAWSASELWNRMPPSIKRRMAASVGLDEERAGTLFTMLAGLHDLGKAYPNFQNKAEQLVDGLAQAGFDFPDGAGKPPHNFVSVPEAERLFATSVLLGTPVPTELARLFAYTLGAHHGVFPQAEDVRPIAGRTLGERVLWQEARDWLARQLVIALPDLPNVRISTSLATTEDRAFAPLLAAFISLADWFGSSRHFQMQGPQGIAQYRARSQSTAAQALKQSGWDAPPPAPPERSFVQLFSYLSSDPATPIAPNALQSMAAEMLHGSDGPALWIIEEEMGAGKTEAAFSIFDHCRTSGAAHGVYIAMPTQATSNAMYDRLADFLQNRDRSESINLVLAHSHATLDPDYRRRMEIAETFDARVYTEESNGDEGALLVRSWFTHNKQTLLAHYGVGTIDQALLGVLQTRHWFVRLFGLAGKVVIFDEVHAYDAYMNTLLARLIEWLAELDCTVVLLSATLPKATRLSLAEAYAKGARASLQTAANAVPYPRITRVDRGSPETARSVQIAGPQTKRSKDVALLHLPYSAPRVKDAILDAIPGDGCAIVICNTVAGAQEMYESLEREMRPMGWSCLLFHARTPFVWRKEREKTVLAEFGKASGSHGAEPRPKTLLVATQVAEQSLDLDADFMCSEIAPVDLILQRMGRLYRHRRSRTTAGPRFALLCDVDADSGLPIFGATELIYERYLLLRSWLALKDRDRITLPDDIEPLVATVYDDAEPAGLPERWTTELSAAKSNLADKVREQRERASRVSVRMQEPDAAFGDWIFDVQPTLLDDDDPETHKTLRALTRDGEPSVTVVLCGTGEAGIALALQPAGHITPEMAQQMMQFSLSISAKAIYHALKSELPPPNWRANTHLKHCRRIVLQDGVAIVANQRLTLTKEKGLQIEAGTEG
jgi:CRISPR-associated endonuclease/helicase Cas3